MQHLDLMKYNKIVQAAVIFYIHTYMRKNISREQKGKSLITQNAIFLVFCLSF